MTFPSQRTTLFLCVACLTYLLQASAALSPSTALRNTSAGVVRGRLLDNIAYGFLGIPYAQPPVGRLRWAEPLPVKSWAPAVLNATEFTAGCPQHCNLPPLTCPPYISEDCLTLNVFTPLTATAGAKLPVMVFIPGGGFEFGGAGTDVYYSQGLVNRTSVVVVNVNYRLGVLGWLHTPTIPANLGLHDQRLALNWVKANIHFFGGDPDSVTLFGQSAGAISTAIHLISPNSTGLFHRAIIESNPWSIRLRSEEESEQFGQLVSKAMGCGFFAPMDCMRNASLHHVLRAQTQVESDLVDVLSDPLGFFLPWYPVVDGVEIPSDALTALASGDYANNNVPVMLGTVANESLMFIWQASSTPLDYLDYFGVGVDIFRENVFEVLAEYPVPPAEENDTRYELSRLGTDYLFTCPSRYVASGMAAASVPVHLYFFNHVFSFYQAWGPNYTFCYDYACHACELPFVFESARWSGFRCTPDEQVLATLMGIHWTNFAKSSDPNIGDTETPVFVHWPAFNTSHKRIMYYATPASFASNDVRSTQCDLFDSIGYL